MDIREAYARWSATYDSDRNLTRDLDQEVTRDTLRERRFSSILEIGCGTGKNTTLFAQIGQRVMAVDFSQAMMARARTKPGTGNVLFAVADLTRPWPLADRYADLVVCNLVLEHIENLPLLFSEASRCLVERGCFFVSELHPFRQYQGTKANFQRDQETTEIPAFVHHISDFLNAAESSGFGLKHLKEWWHAQDQDKPPRLVSFWFEKQSSPR